MAELILDIPDPFIPRIVEAIKPILVEGDAVDIENPTNGEVAAKLKEYLVMITKKFVKKHERIVVNTDFEFIDIPIT